MQFMLRLAPITMSNGHVGSPWLVYWHCLTRTASWRRLRAYPVLADGIKV